ncbi:hypothetical protein RRG08_006908 [Elysia crispata]|uniref:Uncharacterized protein n=1 Tax=Elysia crispata TaxID=231223 RepID=A0AAE1EDZ3_9GAST|nr:hypothetical protein RRG08_006908 [Elysia crispata]
MSYNSIFAALRFLDSQLRSTVPVDLVLILLWSHARSPGSPSSQDALMSVTSAGKEHPYSASPVAWKFYFITLRRIFSGPMLIGLSLVLGNLQKSNKSGIHQHF